MQVLLRGNLKKQEDNLFTSKVCELVEVFYFIEEHDLASTYNCWVNCVVVGLICSIFFFFLVSLCFTGCESLPDKFLNRERKPPCVRTSIYHLLPV
jgi:hypothetical protein